MPEVDLSPKKFADDFLKPFLAGVESHWNAIPPTGNPVVDIAAAGVRQAFVTAANTLVDAFGNIPFGNTPLKVNFPDLFPSTGAGGGGGDGGGLPLPAPPPGLAPIDPVAVLKAIAEAVRDAEKILNESNLALGSASAEVNVVVEVGGIAGANATLKLNLGPTPRG